MKTHYDMVAKPRTKPAANNTTPPPKPGTLVPVSAFQALTFFDSIQQRQCILLYCLGQDGVIREFNAGRWNPYPVTT